MKKYLAILLALILSLSLLTGCQDPYDSPDDDIKVISREDAVKEMNALLSNVRVSSVDAPIDLNPIEDNSAAAALAVSLS